MNEKKELIIDKMFEDNTNAESIINKARERLAKKEMLSESLSVEDAIIYTGENSETFIKNFEAIEKGQLTFNIMAALLGPMYFLYRKMYLSAALFILMGAIVSVSPFLEILMMIIMGLCANFIYYNQVKFNVSTINKKYKNQVIRRELLRQHGGTNAILPMIYASIWIMAICILFSMIAAYMPLLMV